MKKKGDAYIGSNDREEDEIARKKMERIDRRIPIYFAEDHRGNPRNWGEMETLGMISFPVEREKRKEERTESCK